MRCHQDTPRALAPSMTLKTREISMVGSFPLSAADARAASGQRRRGSRGREFGRRRVRTYLVVVQRTARARAIWRGARLLRVCSFARSERVGAQRASVARIRSARGGHQWESNTSDFRCVESTGRSPPGGSGDALYIAVVIAPRDDRDGRDDDGQARAPRRVSRRRQGRRGERARGANAGVTYPRDTDEFCRGQKNSRRRSSR